MAKVVINPRIRGFICTTSHPEGCAANVRRQIAVAQKAGPGKGIGNALVLFGASTGRDGIGGASVLASAEFGEDDEHKRPSVQVGDPFTEKLLLEATLEAIATGAVVGMHQRGHVAAGGLDCGGAAGVRSRWRDPHRRTGRSCLGEHPSAIHQKARAGQAATQVVSAKPVCWVLRAAALCPSDCENKYPVIFPRPLGRCAAHRPRFP